MGKRLLILALIVCGAWWYWTRWRPHQNYKELSGRLENAINQELARSGMTDRNILQENHREISKLGLTWVETERRIKTDRHQIKGLLDRLSSIAQKEGF